MSNVSLWHPTTYHRHHFGESPMEIYGLKLVVGFQWCPVHLPSYWLNNEGTSLSRHSDEQGFNTWHKMTTIWNASWGLPQWETHAFWTPPKIQILQLAFLAWEWITFHLKGKKIDNHLSRELSQVWMQNVITHQVVIVVCYISNCRFAIEIGVWQAISLFGDKRSCRFCSFLQRGWERGTLCDGLSPLQLHYI